jgi:hypothetical protein
MRASTACCWGGGSTPLLRADCEDGGGHSWMRREEAMIMRDVLGDVFEITF